MERMNLHSEQEKAFREIYEQYDHRVMTLAQRAVFLPRMWEEGIIGYEADLLDFEPEFSELKARIQQQKDNGATLIGMARTWYYFSHERQGRSLPFPEGETYDNLEAEETLATTNFYEALSLLRGFSASEADKLLMLASRGDEATVWFVPKDKDQEPASEMLVGVPAYFGVKFLNGRCPVFASTLQTCVDVVHENIEEKPWLREVEMIILSR